jgi:hypothetical protein
VRNGGEKTKDKSKAMEKRWRTTKYVARRESHAISDEPSIIQQAIVMKSRHLWVSSRATGQLQIAWIEGTDRGLNLLYTPARESFADADCCPVILQSVELSRE